MSVEYWTIIGIILVILLPSLNFAFIWNRGHKTVQKMGATLFGGYKRSLTLYLLLVSMMFWLGKSYLSGFRLGLGVGITTDVSFEYLLISVGEWFVIIIWYVILIGGLYRQPGFKWVFPPYSERLAKIWIFRARIWNRSEESLRYFLIKQYVRDEESEYQFHQKAISKIAERDDWIGEVAQEVIHREEMDDLPDLDL